MAAQIPSSSISRRVPLHARFALRLACISAISLAGVALTGCADAITFSQTETSTGQILLAEGEAEEAAIIFANQVRRSPKDYEAHFHLGQAQLAGGRATEAIRSFKTALEVMPLSHSGKEDDQTRFEIVDALSGALAAHDTDGSLLVQIESKSKGNKTLKLLSAMTYAKAGDPDNAIQRFNEAVNLDREDPYATKTGYVQRAYRSKIDGQLHPYLVHVPRYHKPDGKPLPLVLAFHGRDRLPEHALRTVVGEAPDDSMPIDWFAKHLK